MFGGGSLAFWAEMLSPRKIVGVDIQQKTDSSYFTRYAQSRAGRCERVGPPQGNRAHSGGGRCLDLHSFCGGGEPAIVGHQGREVFAKG
jgi:hypothetical protein